MINGPNFRGVLPFPVFSSEKQLADFVFKALDPWFSIYPEVQGVMPSGKKVRLDAVIHSKFEPWTTWGVEFKNISRDYAYLERGLSKWYAQSVDYSYAEWDAGGGYSYGRLPILMCPQPRYTSEIVHTTISHFVGRFNVGGLRLRQNHGWEITMHGDHPMWRSKSGYTELIKNWGVERHSLGGYALAPKEGNRW